MYCMRLEKLSKIWPDTLSLVIMVDMQLNMKYFILPQCQTSEGAPPQKKQYKKAFYYKTHQSIVNNIYKGQNVLGASKSSLEKVCG